MVQCLICGSDRLITRSGRVYCEKCGMGYDVEEIRKAYSEQTAAVTAPIDKPVKTMYFVNDSCRECEFYLDGRKVASEVDPWSIISFKCSEGNHRFEVLFEGRTRVVSYSCRTTYGITAVIADAHYHTSGGYMKSSRLSLPELEAMIRRNAKYGD